MSFQTYKNIHIEDRLQVILFTSNGFLLDSCHTLIDLKSVKNEPLFNVLPFLKKYDHVYRDLQEGTVKRFKNIGFEYQQKKWIWELSIFKKNGQLVCVMEEQLSIKEPMKSGLKNIKETNTEDINLELKTELEQIKKIQKIKQDHFSKIVHDIKLPLTEIVGTTYLLQGYVKEERGKDYIKALSSAARNLDTLLNDLMAFVKSESYHFKLEARDFALSQVIESAAKSFEFKIQQKGIPVSIYVAPEIPNYIQGDSNRLTQILCNLLDNALKFTRKGSIKIEVLLLNMAMEQCQLEFRVADTGVGIPKESQSAIFETYNQVDKQHASLGFGLGLSIVKQLVELQEGSIKVESRLGEGSTFIFSLSYKIPQKLKVV